MAIKRVIMILAASLEFDKTHNSEIIKRESDNFELPQVRISKNCYCMVLKLLSGSFMDFH